MIGEIIGITYHIIGLHLKSRYDIQSILGDCSDYKCHLLRSPSLSNYDIMNR